MRRKKTLSRGKEMDPCYEETCWVEFSVKEGTRISSRHFLEENVKGIL